VNDLDSLFHDAVSDVEPAHRLPAIQARTRRRSRRGWYVAGAAAVAVAAVVLGLAVLPRDPAPAPAPAAPVEAPLSAANAVAVYYVGDTPYGPRLYREWHRIPDGASMIGGAMLPMVAPLDPDYRTLWDTGGDRAPYTTVDVGDDVTRIEIVDRALLDRPAGVSDEEARLALQAVVYSASAEAGHDMAIEFLLDGKPADRVLGVPLDGPVTRLPQLDVLATVSISNPGQNRVVSGVFSADGRASSFEGSVPWTLTSRESGEVVRRGTAQGSMEDHLTPWSTGPIDVSDLAPGAYVFTASTDDPVGPPESKGPVTDTRTVFVE
jgi:hypothetical protein